MKPLIPDFSNQLQEAIIIGQSYKFRQRVDQISNIVFAGMGSNSTAGTIIQNHVTDKLGVPFIVCKEYSLPAFIGSQTLVIISSYSGNTPETIGFLKQAIKAKAMIVCITSGGKIADISKKKKIDCLLLPAGMTSRSCIGYTLVQVLFILRFNALIDDRFKREIRSTIKVLQKSETEIRKQAKSIARKIKDRTPLIYTSSQFEGIAMRFRHQLNENGKVLASHHFLPGMNHNEMEGWYEQQYDKAVILLRDAYETDQVKIEMATNKHWFETFTSPVIELYAMGKNYWAKVFYLIHLTDWISIKLADLRGIDLSELKKKVLLKSELSGLE